MASAASVFAEGQGPKQSSRHRHPFLLSELNTHYEYVSSMFSTFNRISLHSNLLLLTIATCLTLGDGIIWNASSHKAPLAASLSVNPANPASADSFAQDIVYCSKICKNNHQPRNDAVQ